MTEFPSCANVLNAINDKSKILMIFFMLFD
jgi:hypothetical protein